MGATDPDGDLVAVSILDPLYGKLVGRSAPHGNGYGMWVGVTYEPPDRCWTGKDRLEFVACDAHGNTTRGSVEIRVVNRPLKVHVPVLERTVVADRPNTIHLPAATDPDPGDQEALKYEALHLPEARSWTIDPPWLTLVPYRGCFALVIPYRAYDPCGAADGGTVVLWVLHQPAVHAPEGPLSVYCGRDTKFSVHVVDPDFLCGSVRTIVELLEGDSLPFQYEEKVALTVTAASGSLAGIFPSDYQQG